MFVKLSELGLAALSNLLGLVDVMCLIKSPSSSSQRSLTSFKISQIPKSHDNLKGPCTSTSCLYCLQSLLPSSLPGNSHSPLKKHLSHGTSPDTASCRQSSGFNGTATIKIFIYYSAYKIVTICLNEFSIRVWMLFTHLSAQSF